MITRVGRRGISLHIPHSKQNAKLRKIKRKEFSAVGLNWRPSSDQPSIDNTGRRKWQQLHLEVPLIMERRSRCLPRRSRRSCGIASHSSVFSTGPGHPISSHSIPRSWKIFTLRSSRHPIPSPASCSSNWHTISKRTQAPSPQFHPICTLCRFATTFKISFEHGLTNHWRYVI